jgi:hypothetical protein
MSNKMSDSELRIARLTDGESAPPLLSDKLIAKLHEAVEAAQRKRPPPFRCVTDDDQNKQAHGLDADRHR